MVFGSKRGMSPLIATVLLIAFAVAIGTMIMNWSAGSQGTSGVAELCNAISIQTDNGACYADNQLQFSIRNSGSQKVDGLLLGSSSPDSDYDITIKDSALVVGERLDKSVAFLYGGGPIELRFIPMVLIDDELQQCPGAGFIQTELPTCE